MARAGVDAIGLGDDVGTQRGMMMSVDFWREHLKPRLKRVIDAIRETQWDHIWIKYHSDGNITEILNDLAEIGVDILNPVQPECMPLAEVIPPYQDRLRFWGMIGTQSTMPYGTVDDVRAAVEECARFAREGAGIVVAPTHVLEPDVPWENIQALVDAVRAIRL
jgi:uroporphyrinogen decarboxylase